MKEYDQIIENEREWRRHLLTEIAEIKAGHIELKKEMGTLKVRVATISAIIGGSLGALFKKWGL